MAPNARVPVFPKAGIVRMPTPAASAGQWFDCSLVRWRGGVLQPVGGNVALEGALFDGPPRDIITWHDNAGVRWALVGTDAMLWAYKFDTQQVWNITPTGVGPLEPPGAYDGFGLGTYGADAYGTARDPADVGPSDVSAILGDMWSMDLFGQDVMIVPTQDGHLWRWSPTAPATLPAIVANAPTNNRGVFVTDERHVVLIGAGGNYRDVAWSDQEQPTVWTATVSNLAGDKQLETEGRPLCAKKISAGVLIFTDNDVHFMRYVGPPYAYGINKIGHNCGPISARAVSAAGDVVQWMGQQTFWKFGGSIVPVASTVSDWMFSILNRSMVGRVFAATNPSFTEHWWHWPGEGATECNRYLVQNWGDPGVPWAIGVKPRCAADTTGAMLRPITGATDGTLRIEEYGWSDNGNSRVGTIYIETGDFILAGGEGDRRAHVKQILQDILAPPGTLGYRFFQWEQPNGPVIDSGSIPVLDNTGLTDARFSCRGLRMRLEALADGPWTVGRSRLLIRPGGQR